MITYNTPDRHGYSIKFSPFDEDHLLLATSQLFGLAGGGTLYLLKQPTASALPTASAAGEGDSEESEESVTQDGVTELCRFEWSDGLFDVAWCPHSDNVAATASGDGSLQIWAGLGINEPQTHTASTTTSTSTPISLLQEHINEVYGIDWGEQWNYHHLVSASWDGCVKLWDCNRHSSLSTYVGHTDLVYGKPLMIIKAAPGNEVLACDWSQFDSNILATGSSDGKVRTWDLRNMRKHVLELSSGEFAVRRLAFSPNVATIIAAANYDFTTRIWDFSRSMDVLEICENHSEFVCGLDWNLNRPHQLADCGWDALLNLFIPKSLKGLKE